MNKHSMANEYKILCAEANEMVKKEEGVMTSNGWRKIDGQFDRKSNFKGVLYEKNGQYAICFVGTDKFSRKDWGANLKMGTTGSSTQIKIAREFADNMQKKYNLNSTNTVSIGHSEGGTEATIVGLKHNLPTRTFNAYGIWKTKYDKGDKGEDLVINYRDPQDPVSKIHKNVGETFIIPSNQNKFMRNTPFGTFPSHRVDNMGDCENPVPVKEYKKSNPLFIDNISETDITRDDLANMEPDVFKIYEPEINERLKSQRAKDGVLLSY